jgi:hypothetical protein
MFSPFFFMASMAGHWLRMNFRSLGLQMTLQIRNIPVTAIAGETSMNGLSKFPLIDLLGVAANAFRVVDAFDAILATLSRKGVPFFFRICDCGF